MKTAAHIMLTIAAKAALTAALLFVYAVALVMLDVTTAPPAAHGAVGGGLAALIVWVVAFMRIPNPWRR